AFGSTCGDVQLAALLQLHAVGPAGRATVLHLHEYVATAEAAVGGDIPGADVAALGVADQQAAAIRRHHEAVRPLHVVDQQLKGAITSPDTENAEIGQLLADDGSVGQEQ